MISQEKGKGGIVVMTSETYTIVLIEFSSCNLSGTVYKLFSWHEHIFKNKSCRYRYDTWMGLLFDISITTGKIRWNGHVQDTPSWNQVTNDNPHRVTAN
jgi:hypothetical protein